MIDLIRSIQKRDAASPTFSEVVFGYNGFHAILFHRMCHGLWHMELRGLSRFVANIGRMLTGIEIHPAATIGKNLFIDHGTGVVIGQTTIVGNNVMIYQGVTLGGVGRDGDDPGRRHPIIEDDVMIGAGVQVLGGITIGKGAKLGANSVVVNDIPAGCTAIGIPARVVCKDDGKSRAYGLPSRADMEVLAGTIDDLRAEVEALKTQASGTGKKKKSATAKNGATKKAQAKKAPAKKTAPVKKKA